MGIDEAVKLKDLGIPASLIGAVVVLGYIFRPLLKAFSEHIHNVQAERSLNNRQANDNLMSLIKVTRDRAEEQRDVIENLEKVNADLERRNHELEGEIKTLRSLIYRIGGPPA